MAVRRDQGSRGENVGVDEVADVHKIVQILSVAYLESHFPCLGNGDHLAQADGVVLVEPRARTTGDGLHGVVVRHVIGGEDVVFRRDFDESVSAFLNGRSEDEQGLVSVDQVDLVVMNDG